jgi:hypothetical protein
MSDPSDCLLGALTLTAIKHLGDGAVVVEADQRALPRVALGMRDSGTARQH